MKWHPFMAHSVYHLTPLKLHMEIFWRKVFATNMSVHFQTVHKIHLCA